ncbi:MAG: Ni/Fe hydrogenase subunit alpha [Dehalococcoidales bacterium]|nr:Ni/Fe hydrogenase subunit alpha [Dehalococcoidales bacterium]
MTKVNINVHQVTRLEGHGDIVLNATDGKIEELKWVVTESPRFFEAMLRGRHYQDVSHIASRICGICSIAHSTVSIQATEAAFGVKLSEQAMLLRKLLYDAEYLESHVLHVYYLAVPDFLGVGSVFTLVQTHTEAVVRAARLKKLAYNLAELLAGRKTHPISLVVGGFARIPEARDLEAIRKRLEEAIPDLDATVDLVKTLKVPDFVRETEYIALKDPREYALISGQIASSDAGLTPIDNYLAVTNEFCVPHSTAKYTRNKRDSYMVGALARFNLNHDQLLPRAKKAAKALGLKAPCHNPFMITIAQVVEAVHAVEDSLNVIDRLLAKGLREERVRVEVKAGRGIGAVEAPRGILFHDYTYDENGLITNANCIIPTNQNHNNIQKDFEALVPGILGKPQAEIQHTMEMLVRAYDPCISCSTHLLTVKRR